MPHKISPLAAVHSLTHKPAQRLLSSTLLVLGCLALPLSSANAADSMDTSAGISGTAASQHSSQGLPTGSNSNRTADKKSDNGARYQQDSQPIASQQAKDKAKRQVQKSLSGGKVGSEGGRHATTGQAKPTENWFGCSPSGSKQSSHCNGK